MRTTIGLLAHVDAGKTTLAEQILYLSGTVRMPGRVDSGNTLMDYNEIEKRRGISVFLGQAAFEYQGMEFALLDTPGHVDFSSEMERSLAALDYAVVIVSLVEGVSGHTAAVWHQLRERKIPTLFFLNKEDRLGADPERILSQIKKHMTGAAVQLPEGCALGDRDFIEQLFNSAAEVNDRLLERYLEEPRPSIQQIFKTVLDEIEACRLFPCICGSALRQKGVGMLLDLLCCLKHRKEEKTPPNLPEEAGEPAGLVYQVRRDEKNERVVFIKLFHGNLTVKQEVQIRLPSGECYTEKADQIRLYIGSKYRLTETASAGELCGITGFTKASLGAVFGDQPLPSGALRRPILMTRLERKEDVPVKTLLEALEVLQDEDPMLGVEYEECLQQVKVHVMGTVQTEVLKETLKERFGLLVKPEPCKVQYLETITAPVTGYGHYEPLRHYAEVHIRLEPGGRGSGIQAESRCHVDVLSQNYQNLVLQHLKEREHKGVLIGAPLTDVKLVLTTGRAHIKHTEGGDFREAVYRAVRQGLCKAESVLLEPVYRFRITVPDRLSGRVNSDIRRMYGTVTEMEASGEDIVLSGCCPVATMMEYPKELASFAKGMGTILLSPDGYQLCHNAEEIIAEVGYEKEKDPDAVSGSVFCSHGSGFYVPWDEVENYIHCPSEA